MTRAYTLAGIGFVLMLGALAYGFGLGGGWDEVRVLVGYPWFNVSLVDVYIGFALVCGWIWFREPDLSRKLIWTVLILTLGNAVSCLYVLLALRSSGGDWRRFWLGARHEDEARSMPAT